jgi:hypothetical protein
VSRTSFWMRLGSWPIVAFGLLRGANDIAWVVVVYS